MNCSIDWSDLHAVFSGHRGFRIHVWDFDARDLTGYNERDPLKSHEVARYKYSLHLKRKCLNQNKYHFTLSSDVTRIITFPGSLNGETGLICSYLRGPRDRSNCLEDPLTSQYRKSANPSATYNRSRDLHK